MEGKTEVIKHSAAIHIENKVTLLQRRAWNILLAHAYDLLPSQDVYSVTLQSLSDNLGYDSKDERHLKTALRALATCAVEWDILDKDGIPDWGVTTLLAQARIRGGICTYAYSPELRERLHNPTVYARISLSLQNEFTSKHALALYELFVDYLDKARNVGETPYIPLPQFRKLMGIPERAYPEFKKLNLRVIKEPIEEINTRTDLNVIVVYQRRARQVEALKFKIRRIPEVPIPTYIQGDLFQSVDDMPPLVQALKATGLASADAWYIWQQGTAVVEAADKPAPDAFEAYIREKIDLLERRQRTGRVESATGFLLAAIKHNYPNPEYHRSGKRRRAQQAEAQAEQQVELERRFEAHREQVFWQRFGERPETWQAEQRERLEAMLASDPAHRFAWQSYREHGSLRAPSVAGVLMAMLEGELLSQPEERSLKAFTAWEKEV